MKKYMAEPPGFEFKWQEHKECELKNTLSGLKQDTRAWYNIIGHYLHNDGFNGIKIHPTLYINTNP